MTALLLTYAVGAVGTLLAFCRTEEFGFVERVEMASLWPCWLVVTSII